MHREDGRLWLLVGGLIAGLAVAAGAFGAHWLESRIDSLYSDPDLQLKRLANWETAARYQMYHALGLIAIGILSNLRPTRWWNVAGGCLLIGLLIFSGCLYALVLTDIRILGAIVALGGTFQLLGWGSFVIAAARTRRDGSTGRH